MFALELVAVVLTLLAVILTVRQIGPGLRRNVIFQAARHTLERPKGLRKRRRSLGPDRFDRAAPVTSPPMESISAGSDPPVASHIATNTRINTVISATPH